MFANSNVYILRDLRRYYIQETKKNAIKKEQSQNKIFLILKIRLPKFKIQWVVWKNKVKEITREKTTEGEKYMREKINDVEGQDGKVSI